jgi:hypothetical protein
MKKLILFISVLLLFFCVSSLGMAEVAFDNHRQGFIIGGLGGVAVNTYKDRFGGADEDGANIALHTDLRIGGGFKGDKFMLYYWDVTNWFLPIPTLFYPTISGITGLA